MVNIGELLWILDSATGTPTSIFEWANGYGRDVHSRAGFSSICPFVASSTDGRRALVSSADFPAMLQLDDIDFENNAGPRVVYNKSRLNAPADGWADGAWVLPAPTLAKDGTLVWKNANGKVEATAPDGTTRWSRFVPAGGAALMDEVGTTYLAMGAPVALRLADGEALWHATAPPDAVSWAESYERQGAGVFNYWPLFWHSATDGNVGYFSAHSLVDGTVLWNRKLVFPDVNPNWAYALTAQSTDGTLYVSAGGFKTEGIVSALSGTTGADLWRITIPAAEGFESRKGADYRGSLVMGGPIGSRKSRAVYVASSNCKVYGFDWAGQTSWWYRLAGEPLFQTHQLVDGVLYVLAWAPNGLPDGAEVCADDDPVLAKERYECPFPESKSGIGCQPCVSYHRSSIFYLYAFKVE
jgi:hypothetical protein